MLAFAAALAPSSRADATVLLAPSSYQQFADGPFSGLPVLDYFHIEDFEDQTLNTPGLSAIGGVVLNFGDLRDSVDEDDGAVDGSGSDGYSYYSNGSQTLQFLFSLVGLGQLPTHVGIVWTDIGCVFGGAGSCPPVRAGLDGFGVVSFEAFDAANVSLGVITSGVLGDGLAGGATAEDRFFGVIHAGGVSRFTLTIPNSNDWEADHVQYGRLEVPEPAGLALLGVGLAGLGWLGRRRPRAS